MEISKLGFRRNDDHVTTPSLLELLLKALKLLLDIQSNNTKLLLRNTFNSLQPQLRCTPHTPREQPPNSCITSTSELKPVGQPYPPPPSDITCSFSNDHHHYQTLRYNLGRLSAPHLASPPGNTNQLPEGDPCFSPSFSRSASFLRTNRFQIC